MPIEWKELPDPQKSRWTPVLSDLQELRQRPGEWGILRHYDSPGSAKSTAGRWQMRWGPSGFKFATRTLAERDHAIFARFTGEPDA